MRDAAQCADFTYETIYRRLRDSLVRLDGAGTRDVTVAIKKFFCDEYDREHHVLCSGGRHSEFMVDLLVTSFAPKALVEKRTLALVPPTFEVHLAVESELGGETGSSPFGVMKNAVEDFLKLLLVTANRRVMIMTSLAYANEPDHVPARVESLRKMYARFPSLSSGVLIVHLAGHQPRSSQVQVMTHLVAIRGFVVSNNGEVVIELKG